MILIWPVVVQVDSYFTAKETMLSTIIPGGPFNFGALNYEKIL